MSKLPGEKRKILIARTAAALRVSEDTAALLLLLGRQQSLRINPLRGKPSEIIKELRELGWQGIPYEWLPEGLSVESPLEPIRDSKLIAEGKVFIQNAASWLPVLALAPQPNEDILDVCAAPGGKTSHIAAVASNKARITANDNSRPRLAKMRATFARLGVENVELTLFDATQLTRKLSGRQFDKILLDAPCSGEGMMRLDRDKDFTTWSVAQIKRLNQLQKRLIGQAWQLLKPGGTLVYSTCTMAPEENEAVIDYLLRSQEDVRVLPFELALPNRIPTVAEWNGKHYDPAVQRAMRLQSSEQIEAFFICKIQKTNSE